jgi:hypothetical protein
VAVGDTIIAINDIGIHDKEPQEIERLGASVRVCAQARSSALSARGVTRARA